MKYTRNQKVVKQCKCRILLKQKLYVWLKKGLPSYKCVGLIFSIILISHIPVSFRNCLIWGSFINREGGYLASFIILRIKGLYRCIMTTTKSEFHSRYSSSNLIKSPLLQRKSVFIREVTSL